MGFGISYNKGKYLNDLLLSHIRRQIMDYYDQLIYEAIQSSTPSGPCGLVYILGYVDGRDKSILSHDQFNGGLQRLIEDGRIKEVLPHKFIATKGEEASSFSGLSIPQFEQAYLDYREAFEKIAGPIDDDVLDDGLDFQKVLIMWKLPNGRCANFEDLDQVQGLVNELEKVLDEDEAGIFDFGGIEGFIEVPIYGKEGDEATDTIYSLIIDVFTAYPKPPGSHIVRVDDENSN